MLSSEKQIASFSLSSEFYFRIILSVSRHVDILLRSLVLLHVMFWWISEKTARKLVSSTCTSELELLPACDFHYANNNSNDLKKYNFLDCDGFKKPLLFNNLLAKLLSDSSISQSYSKL